jgi:hypothetical protein
VKHVWMALWVATLGCGGVQADAGRPAATPARDAPASATQETEGDPRAEIERLDREIRRHVVAVPPEAIESAEPEATSPPAPSVPAGDAAPGVSGPLASDGETACEQVCQAAGSICRAAQRICALASQMDDDWARGRCTAATRTCRDTRRRTTNHCGPC